MAHDLFDLGKMASSVVAILTVAAVVGKTVAGGWRFARWRYRFLMKTIEMSDRPWSRGDGNPIFSRR